TTGDRHVARAQDYRPQTLEYLRPYDDIGNRCFVFDRHEYDAIGRTRPLPAGDQSRDTHARPGTNAAQCIVLLDVTSIKVRTQELRRMRTQRQMQETVIIEDFLANQHRREMHVWFSRNDGRYRGVTINGK